MGHSRVALLDRRPSFPNMRRSRPLKSTAFFPSIGRRVMVLNARKVYRPGNKTQQVLLAIEDVTERRRLEHEHAAAHERIAALLQELGHRIKNSLQIIVAMVRLEARNHKSGEGKAALERVSHRIDALGRLYSMLGGNQCG